jgi:hypothetical protein
MKLLNCLECHSIVNLITNQSRKCFCGKSAGRYRSNGLYAEFTGPARIIGLINSEYKVSLKAPIIPYVTTYKWFPIISNEEYHVYKLSEEEFWKKD